MSMKLRWAWARLDANYWFYPALFVLCGLALAVVALTLDQNGYGQFVEQAGAPLAATPQSANTMLQVIAAAMLGAAATVFSITIAAVAYASGTYGPRLLSNFLEDKGNQLSLATLLGTFVYALTVLNSVREAEGAGTSEAFAPQIALLGAYALTALSVGVLVYLLNHIPASIRINHVLEGIGRKLIDDIRTNYPHNDTGHDSEAAPAGKAIPARNTGYVQMIHFEGLATIAKDNGCTLALEVRTGDFIHHGKPLIRLCEGSMDSRITDSLHSCFTVGAVRTPKQDPQFLIDELVEIALRALSPGINDPFTAITAIHWLGAAIAELGQKDLRKPQGTIGGKRYVYPLPDDFGHFVARGFDTMRSAVAGNPTAALVMLDTLADAAQVIENSDRRLLLCVQADNLLSQARLTVQGPDLEIVVNRHASIRPSIIG